MVELKEKRLRKSLSEAKNEWQGQKDLNPRHAVLERLNKRLKMLFYPVFKPFLKNKKAPKSKLMLFDDIIFSYNNLMI